MFCSVKMVKLLYNCLYFYLLVFGLCVKEKILIVCLPRHNMAKALGIITVATRAEDRPSLSALRLKVVRKRNMQIKFQDDLSATS